MLMHDINYCVPQCSAAATFVRRRIQQGSDLLSSRIMECHVQTSFNAVTLIKACG